MITSEELKSLWKGRYVENYPHEFFALIQEIQKVNPLKTIIEVGVKCCGTLRVWERMLPREEGLLIEVDMAPKDQLLGCSGHSTIPPYLAARPGPTWEWETCPSNFVSPENCTENPLDPEASERSIRFVIGDSNSLEVHEQIAYILGDKQADMIFHDGGHFGDVPRRDFENIVLPFLRPGGLFVLADFRTDGVDALREHLATLGPVQVIEPDRAGFALWRKPA
jgi:cephalosporin hydroxylase